MNTYIYILYKRSYFHFMRLKNLLLNAYVEINNSKFLPIIYDSVERIVFRLFYINVLDKN